ncbi:hypothetical protein CKN86_04130 [Carnobacterium divergens]|uniref:Cna B-type domain-containing protein n=1 Tax=Carnobacterium divergens TaxID=2748 RepID=UPI000D4899CC|nr:Cna B-type domain-containing protein [Carnobacterium divergens]MCO6018730.1 Cna B-type domain-containing protein [Carnobacterium divergens]TFI63946.1 hypothetical protein CKN62_04165 [Carnobacterium divergens]TFI91109.1 hypothetical protein CKN84_04165 [Carnobacterium divergens]TFJ05976.1 hypothetical protein CKN86_04130 [Carnobacterium divergens]TFJ07624.1 hypothetical protein CKN65_04170 [Carnobacterium divergens]
MIKRTNKGFSLFLIFALVFPTIIGGLTAVTTVANATELGRSKLVDSVKLEKTELYNGERIGISVTFSEKPGVKIKNGDTITMSLPPELVGIVSSAELKDPATGRVFGEAKIVKDQVICTFNQTAEELINVKGYFFFNIRVDSQTEGTISKTNDFGVAVEPIDYTVTNEKGDPGVVEDDRYPFFNKYGYMSEDGSNVITWQVFVNQPKKELAQNDGMDKMVIIEDTSANDQTLLADSFRYFVEDRAKNFHWLTKEEFQQYGTLEIDSTNQNHFSVKLHAKELSTKKFGIVYDTKVNDLGKIEYKNDYKVNYQITGEEQTVEEGTSATENINAGAGGSGDLPEKGSARLVKSLENNDSTFLSGITFELFNSQNQSLGEYQTDENGQINVKEMALGSYYFKETKAPDQFQFDESKQYPFEIKESSTTGELVKVSNGIKKTSLNLKKVWIGPARDQIEVNIYADGRDINQQVTLTKAYNWELLVTNLDQYNLDGTPIEYTVKEVNVPAGFESSVTGDATQGFTITNKNIETVSIPVAKKWVGQPLDSVEVYLKRNNKVTTQVLKLSAENNWQASFDQLPKYDKAGNEIVYSIVEADLAGFSAFYEGDPATGYTITNVRTASISIPVLKKWVGPVGKPVTLELLANDKETGRFVRVGHSNNWQSHFTNLPQYDETGKEIYYTVLEKDKPENYTSVVTGDSSNGFIVTNTNSEKITIPVTKKWLGPIGEKATLLLIQDGKATQQTLTLTSQENWQGTFSELPKYAADGHEINYTIKEEAIPNYSASIKGDAKQGFTVTNMNMEEVEIPVTKKWNGEKQPSVKIYAKANGALLKDSFIELSESNHWKGSIKELPKYSPDGKEINYTVVESQLDGYATTYEGDALKGYTVTNTRTESISIPISKKWVGPIGGNVTINLLTNGKETGRQAVLKADQNWKARFTNLPKYDSEGQLIRYTISEVNPEQYDVSITGDATEGFVVTNTNNEKVTIPVSKKWHGPVGDAVTILLYDNQNIKLKELTLNEENNWQGKFEQLPKYQKDGSLINYFVREEAVENYRPSITGNVEEGYLVTNTNTEKTAVKVTKKWVGPIAGRIQINLVKDGQMVNRFVNLDKSNQWEATFDSLDKYNQDGTEIEYTIVETVGYKNYDEKIEKQGKNNFVVTNTNNETVTIPVQKKWVGPVGTAVTIQLEQNGAEYQQIELNAANEWKSSFSELPKYDSTGKEYRYTIKETAMENYLATISGDSQQGYTVTNQNTETIEIPVTKNWIGPASEAVTVHLEQNSVELKNTLTLTALTEWKGSFKNLPKYDSKGQEYRYTITEEKNDAYQEEITGNQEKGFSVTNRNIETLAIPVIKRWQGPKADQVVIYLEQNGTKQMKSLILNDSTNWQGVFGNLPKYDENGQLYHYTIVEEALPGYQVKITGDSQSGFIVTNTFIPSKEIEKNPKQPIIEDSIQNEEIPFLLPNEKQILKEDFQTKKEVSLPQTGEIQSNPIGMIIGGFLFVISLGGYWISFKGRS